MPKKRKVDRRTDLFLARQRGKGEIGSFIFAAGASLAIILIVSCIIGLLSLRTAELHEAHNNLARLALILSEQTALAFHEIDLVTKETRDFVVSHPSLTGQALHQKLHSLFQHFLQGQALLLFDTKGNMVSHSREYPTPSVNVADRNYFKAQIHARDDRISISRPLRNRVNGHWMISLSRRIFAADGSFAGVVMAAIDMSYFTNLYQALALSPGTRIVLKRLDGAILVTYPFEPERLGRTPDEPEPDSLHAAHGIEDPALEIALSLPKRTALHRWYALAWVIIPGSLIGVFGIAALTASLIARVKKDRDQALRQRQELEQQVLSRTSDLQDMLEFNTKIIDAAPIGIAVYGEDGQCVAANHIFCHMLRLEKGQLLSCNFKEVQALEALGLTGHARQALETGDMIRHEGSFRTPDGQQIWLDFQLVRFYRHKSRHILLLCTDMTEHKALEEELRALAYTDPLTGVNNRRRFLDLAEVERKRARRTKRPFAFCILDIDFFKNINDSYGHDQGDIVLKALAATCRNILRDNDIFGRLGGEEFGAVLVEADMEQAMQAAERLRRAVAENRVQLATASVSLTVSVGVAIWRESDAALVDLMQRADKALYAAKNQGRNRVLSGESEDASGGQEGNHSPPGLS